MLLRILIKPYFCPQRDEILFYGQFNSERLASGQKIVSSVAAQAAGDGGAPVR